jgi:hypothetical protein
MDRSPRICPGCQSPYTPRRKGSRYCSHTCYAASREGVASPGTFPAGIVPKNKVPVGTVRIRERKNRQGERRAFVKVAEPNVWELRARLVWIKAHGPIPDGAHVHHINRDKTDDRIENLELLTPQEHNAEHVNDMHNDAQRGGLVAAWARRKTDKTCDRCSTPFVGVIGREQPLCPRCRNRDNQTAYKARLRGQEARPNIGS